MTSRRGWVELLVTILTILEGLREYDPHDEAKVDRCRVKGINPGRFCVLLI